MKLFTFALGAGLSGTALAQIGPFNKDFATEIQERMEKINDHLTGILKGTNSEEQQDIDEPTKLGYSNFYDQVFDADTRRVKGDKPWMIKFFAPWCSHCKTMAPVWQDFHLESAGEVNVASVDCTTEDGNALCQAFKIDSYPTIYSLPANSKKYFEYTSPDMTNVQKFGNFAKQQQTQSGQNIPLPRKSIFEHIHGLWTGEFFADEFDYWDRQEPYELGYRSFYSRVYDYENKMVLGDKPWSIKFFAPWCPHCRELEPKWVQYHNSYKDRVNVASVDCTTDDGGALCKAFGINSYPTIVLLPAHEMTYYEQRQYNAGHGALANFALQEGGYSLEDDVISGPGVESEHAMNIPQPKKTVLDHLSSILSGKGLAKDDDDDKSIEIDIDNFYGFVVDYDSQEVIGDKPWALKFFAPWCPHCQKMAPIWEKFHRRNENVINVASVDCSTEKGYELCSKLQVEAYPMVYYLPLKSTKMYVNRKWARTMAGYTKFALEDGWQDQPSVEIPVPKKTAYHHVRDATHEVMDKLKTKFLQ